MCKRKKKLAQALLDYIMVFAAIVLVIAAVSYNIMRKGVGDVFNSVGNQLTNAADDMNFEQ